MIYPHVAVDLYSIFTYHQTLIQSWVSALTKIAAKSTLKR